MSALGGLIGAALALLCTAGLVQPMSANLSPFSRTLILVTLLILACTLGLTTGSAVGRRSRLAGGRIRLFAALAGAVCGGLLGGSLFLGLSAAYVHDYAAWPSTTVDLILQVVALPVLGLLGLCLGALIGLLVGGISGLILAVAVPKQR